MVFQNDPRVGVVLSRLRFWLRLPALFSSLRLGGRFERPSESVRSAVVALSPDYVVKGMRA